MLYRGDHEQIQLGIRQYFADIPEIAEPTSHAVVMWKPKIIALILQINADNPYNPSEFPFCYFFPATLRSHEFNGHSLPKGFLEGCIPNNR